MLTSVNPKPHQNHRSKGAIFEIREPESSVKNGTILFVYAKWIVLKNHFPVQIIFIIGTLLFKTWSHDIHSFSCEFLRARILIYLDKW